MSFEEWGGIDDIASQGGVSESNKEGAERAAEQARQRTAALQALQKQEGKARKQEASLIHILVQFIQSGTHRDIVNIIVKLLEQNIPVQLILGILSLVFTELQSVIQGTLPPEKLRTLALSGPTSEEVSRTLAQIEEAQEFHADTLPQQAKQDLNLWLQHMLLASSPVADIVLKRCIKGEYINSTAIRLMAVTLERYLAQHRIKGHNQRMMEFCTFILRGVMKQLYQQQVKQLSSK